ncbi:MAG: DUF1826 domain-containing protein [Methylocystaceae bacterium]|nr:DUF1826 domain-containing protein [Methylocystaceae bacterium]
MTLRPTVVSPLTMQNRRTAGGGRQPIKRMVIDCKNDTQWNAIHAPEVNGVVLRRRPIRAIETFLDQAGDDFFNPQEFICAQSRMRNEFNKRLFQSSEEEELRRKFLVNDIANWVRILMGQAHSRDYLFKLCTELPTDFQSDPAGLKMIITYRGQNISFRQPKDTDEKSFAPYGVALFRGSAYEAPVEWHGRTEGDRAFYLTVEPASRRMRR